MVAFTTQRQEARVRALLKGNGSLVRAQTIRQVHQMLDRYGDTRRAKPCYWFPSHPHGGATAEVEIMQGCRNAVAGVKVLNLLVLTVQQYK